MTEALVTLVGPLQDRDSWSTANCALARTMDLLGHRSVLLLLREAFYGSHRFDEFARRVGVSESVAAARLKELVDAGLMERRPYQEPGSRTRFDYHLTPAGRDFFPVLVGLWGWGQRWLSPAGIEMVHHGCQAPVRAELGCTQGHHLDIGDIDLVPAADVTASP